MKNIAAVENQKISFRIGINKRMFNLIKEGTQKLFATKINVPNTFYQIVFRNGKESFLVKNPTYILCDIRRGGNVFIDGKLITDENKETLKELCGNAPFMGFGEIWLIVLDKSIYQTNEKTNFLHLF